MPKLVKQVLVALLILVVFLGLVTWIQQRANKEIEAEALAAAQAKAELEIANEREAKLREEKDKEIATLRGAIDSANTQIASLTETLVEKDNAVALRDIRLRQLLSEVQTVIDANPALKELINEFRLQIEDKDTIILSLKKTLVLEREKEMSYQKIVQDLIDTSESWKRQCEKERDLRIALESSFAHCQKSLKTAQSRLKWYAVGAGILGAVAGSALHR